MIRLRFAVIFFICISNGYAEFVQINKRISVAWNISRDNIIFTILAKANGWIGIGFGAHAAMKNADLIVAGVLDGKPYIYDLHGIDDDTPIADKQIDYHLLDASENSTHTMIRFDRKLITGDKRDNTLKKPVFILWAFNVDEDAGEGYLPYHGTNRGTTKEKRSIL